MPLRTVALRTSDTPNAGFPFTIAAIRTIPVLEMADRVTFFVGENGTGKSTLLEAIAIAAGIRGLGSEQPKLDTTLAPQRDLASHLRLTWSARSSRGFFLRAEDFFGYLRRQARDDARIRRERSEIGLDAPPPGRADDWRSGEHPDESAAVEFIERYDSRSHGESFLDVFGQRTRGKGLYLLDEPEAPLSPQRQLSLIRLLADAVDVGAQFIIATHSPILLAFPGAKILSFDGGPITEVAYADLEHVALTRAFLNAPELYLQRLLAKDDE
ncbi:MAG: ABC transporter, ATP-binding protein [uncultured Gemmatimonadetes bacterium]|uniref:ABC transporter, ATP-binding protein n=1 Tax=uncultured Gemmatimonadota bacterium TaxID=203437 RepID=A0A6J4KWR7_9BACT|nr:MAG: ABC transporter, ATP-binding protein [uncultured Gemmatimonadota bacterium]